LLVAAACLAGALPLVAAQRNRYGRVELTPFLSELANPTFITHAGDDTNRLFITEQAGSVRVWRGGSTAGVFLDIRRRVLAGGERGLLGLAFHPLYRANGRFFVYYTRAGDGAIVVAEYQVSANPDVAQPTEAVLLTIAHPTFANHNGGMLAFGPGGYLFIGVGDGGSANDPPNNAQNTDVLLGKILRLDVDHADAAAGTPYTAPPSNPFVGTAGRDEIFAFGLRNPWRFSFDRASGQQWVADVGQGAREEVDTPILSGGNYGWHIYEGGRCTNVEPGRCQPGTYLAPLFDYAHDNGRCSITGGYIYRGPRLTFAHGTYVYGDYCSGEIFSWNGRQQRVLVNTNLEIASFGEDEAGEIYVVDLGGTVSVLSARRSQ
jgi:glucose/arabinose dehydrogenase